MGLEFFRETGRGYRPKASIRKQGQIGLNQGAIKRFGVGKFKFAVLGFDRDIQRVYVHLTNNDQELGSNRVMVRDNNGTIGAKAFLDYFDIDYQKETKSYEVKKEEGTGYLIFDLQEEEPIS